MTKYQEESRITDTKENMLTKIPALLTLMRMGYRYLSPTEALAERLGKHSDILLEGILERQLRRLNSIDYKGETYPFSNKTITAAMEELKHYRYDGLALTGSMMYHLLISGKNFAETIRGNTQSHTIRYIDWENWENNAFHVTAEFQVEREGGRGTFKTDIVLFVNGIPFGVIETKIPGGRDSMEEGIQQLALYQRNKGIPKLFVYCHVLMVTDKNTNLYATTGTKREHWSTWREQEEGEQTVYEIIQHPIEGNQLETLFNGPFTDLRPNVEFLTNPSRLISPMDRALTSLFKPRRLLELSYGFLLHDIGTKKIARYHQYFAVKKTLERIKRFSPDGRRMGGVIWHTQGSGMSHTMVMIARALAREKSIANPRILLVTDRIGLQSLISDTFKHCGLHPLAAKSGRHLLELLRNENASVITTVVDKFHAAFNRSRTPIDSPNIFVLKDENHRDQYGTINIKMTRVLRKACYIGFTGTPLKKADKNTVEKFGGFIDTYTLSQGVEDSIIVPLL